MTNEDVEVEADVHAQDNVKDGGTDEEVNVPHVSKEKVSGESQRQANVETAPVPPVEQDAPPTLEADQPKGHPGDGDPPPAAAAASSLDPQEQGGATRGPPPLGATKVCTYGSTDARLLGMDPNHKNEPSKGWETRGRPAGSRTRPGVRALSTKHSRTQKLGLARWLGGRTSEVAKAAEDTGASTDDHTRLTRTRCEPEDGGGGGTGFQGKVSSEPLPLIPRKDPS